MHTISLRELALQGMPVTLVGSRLSDCHSASILPFVLSLCVAQSDDSLKHVRFTAGSAVLLPLRARPFSRLERDVPP